MNERKPIAYQGTEPYIFVSYAHADKEIVWPFILALQEKYNVWYDDGIEYGKEWEDFIADKLEYCALFLFVLTPISLESQNCMDELAFARDLKKPFVNILTNSEMESKLPRGFKLRYGRYQMCKLDMFATLSDAVADLGKKCEYFAPCATKAKPDASSMRVKATANVAKPIPVAATISGTVTARANVTLQPYSREGDYIYFGTYPQDAKADSVTITDKRDNRGYFLGSDGASYAKAGDGFYKVMPIKWRILEEKNGEAFLLADKILAAHRFDKSNNNYERSEIRAWLNKNFYGQAFNEEQKKLILRSEVDNSARSTNPNSEATAFNSGNNDYACANTQDNVFLLSEQEVTAAAYGFSSSYSDYDTARCKQNTDYAKCQGAWTSTDGYYKGNGYWWLRSPGYDRSSGARFVRNYGYAASDVIVLSTLHGVVPALKIKLS